MSSTTASHTLVWCLANSGLLITLGSLSVSHPKHTAFIPTVQTHCSLHQFSTNIMLILGYIDLDSFGAWYTILTCLGDSVLYAQTSSHLVTTRNSPLLVMLTGKHTQGCSLGSPYGRAYVRSVRQKLSSFPLVTAQLGLLRWPQWQSTLLGSFEGGHVTCLIDPIRIPCTNSGVPHKLSPVNVTDGRQHHLD